MADGNSGSSRPWPTALALFACVALELGIASMSFDVAARVTALLGLAAIAVTLSLRQALGTGRASLLSRAIIYVPLLFCVVVIVVLVLDAHFRRAQGPR